MSREGSRRGPQLKRHVPGGFLDRLREHRMAIRSWLAVTFPAVAVLGCGSRQAMTRIDIVAHDYAFEIPPSAAPGLTAFRFINAGSVPHEVQLFRFRRGLSVDSARAIIRTGDVPDSLGDPYGIVLIASPRDTTWEQALVDLQPGEVYALLCQFRDRPGTPRHSAMGMFSVLPVRGSGR